MPQVAGPLSTTQPYIPLISHPERCPGMAFVVADQAAFDALDKTLLIVGQQITFATTGVKHKWNGTGLDADDGLSPTDRTKLDGIAVPASVGALLFRRATDATPSPLHGASIPDSAITVSLQNPANYLSVRMFLNGRLVAQQVGYPFDIPLDMTSWPGGAYSIRALCERSDANVMEVIEANFTLAPVVTLPRIMASTPQITVRVTQGYSPQPRSVRITASDDSSPTVTITDDAAWLTSSPASGALPLDMTLSPTTDAQVPGTYRSEVLVEAAGYEPAILTFVVIVEPSGAYNLILANNEAFTSPFDPDGAVLLGNFNLRPDPLTSGITSVIYKDGVTTLKTRTAAPFDLGSLAVTGTDAAAVAVASDSKLLANGPHIITAEVRKPGRKNDILYSRTYNTTAWSKYQSTVDTTPIASWDGTVSATRLIVQQISGQHDIHVKTDIVKPAQAEQRMFIVRAKADQFSWICMRAHPSNADATNFARTWFDLTNGLVGAGGQAGSYTRGTPTITALSGGYWLCAMPFTTGSETTVNLQVQVSNGDGSANLSFTPANATSGIIIADFQCYVGTTVMGNVVTTSTPIAEAEEIITLTADVTVANPVAALSASLPELFFSVTEGDPDPTPKTFELYASEGTAEWSIVPSSAWSAATASGTATPGTPATVTVSPGIAALPVGRSSATLTIAAAGYVGASVIVTVEKKAATLSLDIYASSDLTMLSNPQPLRNLNATGKLALYAADPATPGAPKVLAAGEYARWFVDLPSPAGYAEEQGASAAVIADNLPGDAMRAQAVGSSALLPETLGVHGVRVRLLRPNVSGYTRVDAGYSYGAAAHVDGAGWYCRANQLGHTTLDTPSQTLLSHPMCSGYIYILRPLDLVPADPGANYANPNAITFDWTKLDAIYNAVCVQRNKNLIVHYRTQWGSPLPAWQVSRAGWTASDPVKKVFLNYSNVQAVDHQIAVYTAMKNRYASDRRVIAWSTEEMYVGQSGIDQSVLGTQLVRFAQSLRTVFHDRHLIIGENTTCLPLATRGQQAIDAGVGWFWPDCNPGDANGQDRPLMLNTKGICTGLYLGDQLRMGDTDTFEHHEWLNAQDPAGPQATFFGIRPVVYGRRTGVSYVNGNQNWLRDVIAFLDKQTKYHRSALVSNLVKKQQ